jgi:hypothetical protein
MPGDGRTPLPSERPPSASKAPRPLRLKSEALSTSLPPGAALLVDSLVGTFYGSTRSEVLRFMVVSWITEHHEAVLAVGKKECA